MVQCATCVEVLQLVLSGTGMHGILHGCQGRLPALGAAAFLLAGAALLAAGGLRTRCARGRSSSSTPPPLTAVGAGAVAAASAGFFTSRLLFTAPFSCSLPTGGACDAACSF